MITKIHSKFRPFDFFLYLCVLLSGLTPRYILDFKIHLVIGISMYTVFVVLTWFLFVRHIRLKRNLECIFFFIWLFLVIGSIWRAKRLGVWAYYVDWTVTAILFMQLLYHRLDDNTFEIVVRTIVDSLFIQLMIGLYEITNHRYLFEIGRVSARLYGKVAISMFYNLNDYSTFIVTILPFSIYLFMKNKSIVARLYYSCIFFISIFLALKSESRGASLSLLLIVGTVLYLFIRKSKTTRTIGAIVIGIVVFVIAVIPQFRNLLLSFWGAIVFDQSGKSDDIRINLMKNGLYFLRETYGLGVGAGNLIQWLSERAIYPIEDILFMHNWYLEIAVTFGVAFFVLYMVLHIRTVIGILSNFSVDKGFWNMNNTILISFVAFSLVSISSSSNIYSEWVWMYLVFVTTFVMYKRTLKIQK